MYLTKNKTLKYTIRIYITNFFLDQQSYCVSTTSKETKQLLNNSTKIILILEVAR